MDALVVSDAVVPGRWSAPNKSAPNSKALDVGSKLSRKYSRLRLITSLRFRRKRLLARAKRCSRWSSSRTEIGMTSLFVRVVTAKLYHRNTVIYPDSHLSKRIEKSLRFFQVFGIEAFGEPMVDRLKNRSRLVQAPCAFEEARVAYSAA